SAHRCLRRAHPRPAELRAVDRAGDRVPRAGPRIKKCRAPRKRSAAHSRVGGTQVGLVSPSPLSDSLASASVAPRPWSAKSLPPLSLDPDELVVSRSMRSSEPELWPPELPSWSWLLIVDCDWLCWPSSLCWFC